MKVTENPELPGSEVEDLTGVELSSATMEASEAFAVGANIMEWDGRGDLDYDSPTATDTESQMD